MVRGDDEVTILDFGIATAADQSRLTRPGTTLGSRRFIAPEVWSGATATKLSDIIFRAMAQEPHARYPSAAALDDALAALERDEAASAAHGGDRDEKEAAKGAICKPARANAALRDTAA